MKWLARLMKPPAALDPADAAAAAEVARLRLAADRAEFELMRNLRQAGREWRDIAWAAGCDPRHVQQRYRCLLHTLPAGEPGQLAGTGS